MQEVGGGRCVQEVGGRRCVQEVGGGRCVQEVGGGVERALVGSRVRLWRVASTEVVGQRVVLALWLMLRWAESSRPIFLTRQPS